MLKGMNVTVSLTPHFEQFVRQQLAAGRFNSEDEVINAALRLLEYQSLPQGAAVAGDKQMSQAAVPADLASGRRSPRGLLADIRSDITAEEIMEARREMWSGLASDKA